MSKKKCKCGKKKKDCKGKCDKCFHFGTYYIIGNDNPNKNLRKMICEMTDEGKNVYHFFSGKPGGCPPGGCH